MKIVKLLWMNKLRELIKSEKNPYDVIDKFLEYGHQEELRITKTFFDYEEVSDYKAREDELRVKAEMEDGIDKLAEQLEVKE